MARYDETLILGAMIGNGGGHRGSWRHPDVATDICWNINEQIHIAKILEQGKFHALFVADFSGINEYDPERLSKIPKHLNLEPMVLLSALATQTENIGLVGTLSTSYYQPFNVAKILASLDHVSHGRAGWNLVTSFSGQEHFGQKQLRDHAERYQIAEEFVDVVRGLWNSWEDDAFLADKGGS